MSYIGSTPTQQSFVPSLDYFSGNGSTVAFTLSRPVASVAQVQVNISNVAQNPSSAYSVNGNVITFTSAPPSGTNNIYVYYTSPITQVIAPGQGTVTSESFGTITNFTTTGNTVLGDASTDTLNVGNGGLVKDASGNVGIGTASPAYKLQANAGGSNNNNDANTIVATGTNHVRLKVHTPTTGGFRASLVLSSDEAVTATGNEVSISTTGSDEMQFATGGSERARIDSSGNLLVGTTSNGRTDSNGTAIDPTGVVYQNHITGTASGSFYTRFSLAGTQIGSISQSGTTAVAYTTSSDYRLKNTIAPMTGALAKVQQLKPVTYKWNADGSDSQGFIAHELQEVVPDCVHGEKDAVDADGNPQYQGIDTSFLVATLTAAIQEQQALITTLTNRITALENK